ncbi:MAG: UDP-N-acetylglucosamine--N-acetylmuramyl-(pentapeptide) pyrophosphoryl-undecaprenol N-acetylglucosamine transferase [Anaerolineales bacterium]
MRLLICAGGTGGGVYPALAVLQTIQDKAEVLWVGGEGGLEARLVERAKVPFKTIPAAGVHGVGLKTLPGNVFRLVRGFFAARRILYDFKPDVLFFTGGYLAVPMALASLFLPRSVAPRRNGLCGGTHIPTALYVPDIEPALALKTLARFADKIAVTAQDSFRYFPPGDRPISCEAVPVSGRDTGKRRLVLTGYPTRADLTSWVVPLPARGWTRSDARRTLGLAGPEGIPVLLVVGGSRGARSINNAVLANLSALLEQAQVIHITGELDWPTVQARFPRSVALRRNGSARGTGKELSDAQAARYHPFPYLHEEMGAALAAADLALSRAGASTLGEYPLFGLPAVLVPYPYAWRYQKVNADTLVRHGAALMVTDSNLKAELLPTIKELLQNPTRLSAMRAAAKSLSHPQAATEIGHLLLELAGKKR